MSDTISEPNGSTEDGSSVSEKHGHAPQGDLSNLPDLETTLAAYLKQYRDDGLEGLKILHYKGQTSRLLDHKDSLEAYFNLF